MTDFSFEIKDNYEIDLEIENGEFVKDNTLQSRIMISLFTDARCDTHELPAFQNSKRGYWGDCLFGEETGSKLWLLDQTKANTETLNRAKSYATEALSWIVEDGLADDLNVEASFDLNKRLSLRIQITKDKQEKEALFIENMWEFL